MPVVGLIGAAGLLTALVPGSMLLMVSSTVLAKNVYKVFVPSTSEQRVGTLARVLVPIGAGRGARRTVGHSRSCYLNGRRSSTSAGAGSPAEYPWATSGWAPRTPRATLRQERYCSTPDGYSETEIPFPYGATRFASKLGQLAGNHFLTVTEGLEKLWSLGEMTLWEGARDIVFDHA
ncbi:MAG TPA: DUF3830 family protein [Rubrobacter sp.]